MKVWTVQAPEVAKVLISGTDYRADWERVSASLVAPYRVMTQEMKERGIDCNGAPPVWTWQGWAAPGEMMHEADMLLGADQWAHGVVALRLSVPDEQALATSYTAWNDFIEPWITGAEPAAMDFRGIKLEERDTLQVTIPLIKARWLRRVRPLPMPRHVRQLIHERYPELVPHLPAH